MQSSEWEESDEAESPAACHCLQFQTYCELEQLYSIWGTNKTTNLIHWECLQDASCKIEWWWPGEPIRFRMIVMHQDNLYQRPGNRSYRLRGPIWLVSRLVFGLIWVVLASSVQTLLANTTQIDQTLLANTTQIRIPGGRIRVEIIAKDSCGLFRSDLDFNSDTSPSLKLAKCSLKSLRTSLELALVLD